MSDDGFHEIQLNGKQLVFLFMAATVVSVVIFLCGVMVGRGVRAERGAQAAGTSAESLLPGESDTPADAGEPAGGAPLAPPDVPAESPIDFEERRLTAERPVKETLEPEASPPAARQAEEPEQPRPASRPEPSRAAADSPEPPNRNVSASEGFAVQLAALRDRVEADAIVKRLAAKGYPAYVQNPLAGRPPVYRVQVGRYPTRDEAEKIAARLKSEEQFSPWIIR